MAMARELVTEKGIGERADQVWANLQKKQEEVFAVRSSETEDLATEVVQDMGLAESETSIAPTSQLIPLVAPLESIPRKTSRHDGVPEGQLTLF